MRGDFNLSYLLPSQGDEPLDHQQVMELVRALKPGFSVPGNLERNGGGWLLRATFNKPTGGCLRRCLRLPDETTAQFVGEAIIRYRVLWWEHVREPLSNDDLEKRFTEIDDQINQFDPSSQPWTMRRS